MSDEPETAAERDLAEILARKAQGRHELARRSFAEKIERMEALRERLAPFKELRERRRAARAAASQPEDADGGGETEGSGSATSAGSNS
jgi:hypothetical protein